MTTRLRERFVRVLGFLLGIKHKSFDEMAEEGRLIRINFLNNQIGKRAIDAPKEIWLVGAIKVSENKFDDIKARLINGETIRFKIPDFEPTQDYINFYYVVTTTNRFYIYASSDNFGPTNIDQSLMLVELKNAYSTEGLSSNLRYT